MTRVIASQRLPQFRDASLPGIEGLAFRDTFLGRGADEIGRRKISLAYPKRDEPLAPASVIGDRHNPAFG